MKFTGERMIPEHNRGMQLYEDHVARYRLACAYAQGRVLDVACGSGYGSKMLAEAGCDVVGMDVDAETVAYAKEHFAHPRVQFVVGDAQRISGGPFDMIVSLETIEHFRDTAAYLNGVEMNLAEDGIFVVSTPNTDQYPGQSQFHPVMFSEAELTALLRERFRHLRLYGQHGKRYIVAACANVPLWPVDLPGLELAA